MGDLTEGFSPTRRERRSSASPAFYPPDFSIVFRHPPTSFQPCFTPPPQPERRSPDRIRGIPEAPNRPRQPPALILKDFFSQGPLKNLPE